MVETDPPRGRGGKTRIFRSVGAVLGGFLAVFALSVMTDLVLESLGIFPPMGEGLFIRWMLLLALGYRTVYAIAGGYMTARLAPARVMRHVVALGILGTAIAGIGAVGAIPRGLSPAWFPIALVLLAFPSVWLGGWLWVRARRQPVTEATASSGHSTEGGPRRAFDPIDGRREKGSHTATDASRG